MLAIIMVPQDIQELFNLYSNSLYMANLLPHLLQALVKLGDDPISPIMVTLRGLLKGRWAPIHIQHLRGHSNLPRFLFMGNNWADQLATGP